MKGFKRGWLLGCGVRIEHYLMFNTYYLIIPMYGYIGVDEDVVDVLGNPDYEA